jgi:iron(III) transport system permease protein
MDSHNASTVRDLRMRSGKIPLLLSLFISILFVIPLLFLIFGSFYLQIGTNTAHDLYHAFIILKRVTIDTPAVFNTLVQALGGAGLAMILGVIYSWIVIRTDVPGKRVLAFIPYLVIAVPVLFKMFAWVYIFNPQIGMGNILLFRIFGAYAPIFNINTLAGMIFVVAVGGIPFVYIFIEPALKNMDPSFEEASRISGSGYIKTLFRVTVPVLLPAIFTSFILVAIFGIENIEGPLLIGTPGGIPTLASQVYDAQAQRIPPQYFDAAIISSLYFAIMLVMFGLYMWSTRKTFKFVTVTGKATQQRVLKLHKWKYAAFAVCFIIAFFSFILPFSVLVLMSFLSLYTVGLNYSVTMIFTLKNYIGALTLPLFTQAMINSFVFSAIAAVGATLLGVIMTYTALKSKVRGSRLIEYFSSLPMSFPGIVYGLAIFWTFLFLPGVNNLYGTLWPVVFALLIIRLPHSTRIISGNMIQISDEMEEASRVAGASWSRTMISVVIPLLKLGLTNSIVFVFIQSVKELGAPILLVSSQTPVLMVLLMNMYGQHPGLQYEVAAAAVMVTLIICAALLVYQIIEKLQTRSLRKREELKIRSDALDALKLTGGS